ncbi:MAG: arginine-tRNA-protein transferase [Saprospiraceae bacterium]
MFAEKHYPEHLLTEELDAYLARGWYRMGQSIFTTHFLCFGDQFYSAIWVRLALKHYNYSKSLRKILRRNNERFTASFTKSQLTYEKEQLYQRYKASFPGMLAPTLKESLLDGEEYNIFQTYEVNVYDGSRLVALSFFDVGKDSAASILGIYDPTYSDYSLGLYTMLMEIEYCLQHDMSYFYPGYVVPGYPRFDYKLRIGDVQYYNISNDNWLPFKELSLEEVPMQKMQRKLDELQQVFKKNNIPSKQYLYPLFEANLFAFWQTEYFDFPVFLMCYPQEKASSYFIVIYDMHSEAYHLLECTPLDDLMFYVNESYASLFDRRRFFLELIVIKDQLLRTSNPEHLALTLLSFIIGKRLK